MVLKPLNHFIEYFKADNESAPEKHLKIFLIRFRWMTIFVMPWPNKEIILVTLKYLSENYSNFSFCFLFNNVPLWMHPQIFIILESWWHTLNSTFQIRRSSQCMPGRPNTPYWARRSSSTVTSVCQQLQHHSSTPCSGSWRIRRYTGEKIVNRVYMRHGIQFKFLSVCMYCSEDILC